MATIIPNFKSSRLKVKRANKYITEIETLVREFAKSDFYTVRIENDRQMRYLCFDVNTSTFPFDDAALAIGDALHNLRTALDHLWYQVVLACGGRPTQWTRFPVFDAEDRFVATIVEATIKKQVTANVRDFMIDTMKPYKEGIPSYGHFTFSTSPTNTRCLSRCFK